MPSGRVESSGHVELPGYVELQVTTNFSFLRGASHPREMVLTAQLLGHSAIGIADRNTLAGVVRLHAAAREVGGIRALVGCRLDFADAPSLLCYPADRAAYGRLCRLLTLGRRRAPKGACLLHAADLVDHAEGQILLAPAPEDRPRRTVLAALETRLRELRRVFGDRVYLALQHLRRGDDAERIEGFGAAADAAGVPVVATNDVHYHLPERRALQDVLVCIREGCTIAEAGRRLFPNGERHLKSADDMLALFEGRPDAVTRTLEVAARCLFNLQELRYEYPDEPIPEGKTPQEALEDLTWECAGKRYPGGVPDKVRETLLHELTLIREEDYARYFLTVHDIVRFAEDKGILCQGRGSAANSAVCYVLGITAVDPTQHELLFERFISTARKEPPDIDVDFEHERREAVIQYVYEKYGRDRAGLAATVICYRPKMAIRDVGKALGLSMDMVGLLSKTVWSWGAKGIEEGRVREVGLDPRDPTLARALALTAELVGFPRHLSQHVGGFVIARGRLDEMVPVENAAMKDRTVIQWDKDDLDAIGMFKIDLLALGMLTCLKKSFDFLEQWSGQRLALYDVPQDDRPTYAMIQKADTIGVFQIESRAQMTMLPRLRPERLCDLVIEVAIVRPGPIQGDMVHPYLKRREALREGREVPDYHLDERLRPILEKTLGVPLFQEQAMRIAIECAGFSPSEADQLRRSMATFKQQGDVSIYRDPFIEGMVRNNFDRDFAARCFRQIEGFGSYGFPESHAASFALLAYASAWVKCHHPAIFCAALLNSQPMGFYAPAQLVRDAREHGVDVRTVDVNASQWDCTLEGERLQPAVRLGFRLVKGFREDDAKKLVGNRNGAYGSVHDVWQRAGLDPAALERLAQADAWTSVGLSRREALWQVRALNATPLPLFSAAESNRRPGDNRPSSVEHAHEPPVLLPPMPPGQAVMEDYRTLSLSLKAHPLHFLRPGLALEGIVPAAALKTLPAGRRVMVAGLVLIRQRPGTASGVVFVTVEDETGVANVVVWSSLFERDRKAALGASLLRVQGHIQRDGEVTHLVAERLTDLSDRLRDLAREVPVGGVQGFRSRDFR